MSGRIAVFSKKSSFETDIDFFNPALVSLACQCRDKGKRTLESRRRASGTQRSMKDWKQGLLS